MVTIGKQWMLKQRQAEDDRQAEERARIKRVHAAEAQQIISQIPGIIENAGGDESVRIFGWVEPDDVAGTEFDRVDKLAQRLNDENRVLHPDDLDGRAAIVFAWCDENDLECFLTGKVIHMNDDEYDFCVRPKKTG